MNRDSSDYPRGRVSWRALMAGVVCLALASYGQQGGNRPGGAAATGELRAAIDSRTEVTVLQDECAQQNVEVLDIMRKVVAKAEAKSTEGNILLTKDRYAEAVTAFKESATLYRQVIDGRKLLTRLVDAERAVAAARVLAETAVTPDTLADAHTLQLNAEGYLQAGEFEAALGELAKAQKAFAARLPAAGEATLESVVAARTAMLALRGQIKGLGKTGPGDEAADESGLAELKRRLRASRSGNDAGAEAQLPRPGSVGDITSRALAAERAAARALEERQYAPAQALFTGAAKLYGDLAALQAKRSAAAADRQSVEQNQKLADAAFKGDARPASFERGKQALADADKALAVDDFETSRKYLAEATERFAAARVEAAERTAAMDAQQAWDTALAAADTELLERHAAAAVKVAKTKAAEADGKLAAGEPKAAATAWTEAVSGLQAAAATALTKEKQAKAVPVLARLEAASAAKDRFAAVCVLAELEQLIPNDPRLAGLRTRAAALPWAPSTSVALGGGVSLEFVLIHPGSFQMGSEIGDADGKPMHSVTLTKPFYLGKYEVTQEQWQAVMGANPSSNKGPKLAVEQVRWDDCQMFLAKVNGLIIPPAGGGDRVDAGSRTRVFRLPTEAEWEYACRAGTTTPFSFGDDEAGLGEYAWFAGNSGSKTHDVGTKKPNAWGLHDMHGNVSEWCADWKGDYSAEAATDPTGPARGSERVFRGGSWYFAAENCRSTSRIGNAPGLRYDSVGFRVAVTPEVQP